MLVAKLFKLKSWLTLDEAADHLGSVLNEKVTITDILRLALDRHLILSINLVNGLSCCKGVRIPIDQVPLVVANRQWVKGKGIYPADLEGYPDDADPLGQRQWCADHSSRFESGELVAYPKGGTFTAHHGYIFDKEITSISGVWDIPLIGSEALDVEHRLQSMIEGPDVTGVCLDGTFLVSASGEKYVRIMEHVSENEYVKDGDNREKYPWGRYDSYHPAGRLPSDEIFVVRTENLSRFIQSLQEDESSEPKPIKTREMNGLLRVIVALAKEARIDISEGKGGAAAIEAAVAAAGFDGPKERTIRAVLKQAREVE